MVIIPHASLFIAVSVCHIMLFVPLPSWQTVVGAFSKFQDCFWPTVLSVEPMVQYVVCLSVCLSVICLSVCNVLYCGKTVRPSQKVSEGVNRKPGSKSSFFGRSHISTSGFVRMATASFSWVSCLVFFLHLVQKRSFGKWSHILSHLAGKSLCCIKYRALSGLWSANIPLSWCSALALVGDFSNFWHWRRVVISENWHEGRSASYARNLVVDKDRMRSGHWFSVLLSIIWCFSTVVLVTGRAS